MPSGIQSPGRTGPIRVLWERSVWRELWVDLKRAHKDRRARRHLGSVSLWIGILALILVAAIAYVVFLLGSGSFFFLPFVIPIIWWLRRGERREFQPMRIAPAAQVDSRIVESNLVVVRSWFADLALLYAVLLDRTGSERFLKEKELPPGMEVTSRRVHMEVLRSSGIWERISPQDREVIMMADGTWDWERINLFATGIEPLRLLRWVLRIDFRLPTVGQQLWGDFGIAHEVVVDPQRLRRGSELIDADIVRSCRDDAHSTLLRCIAEAISRGYQVAESEETAAWAKRISEELAGNQDEDFLLGDNLVSEATPEQLGWATTLANIRTEFLSMVLELLEGDRAPEDSLTSIFVEEQETVSEPN